MKNQIHFETKMEVKNYRKKGKIKQNQNLQQKNLQKPENELKFYFAGLSHHTIDKYIYFAIVSTYIACPFDFGASASKHHKTE